MKARVLLLVVMIAIGCCAAQNPVPLVNNPLVPSSAVPGGAGFTLTVNGTGFVSGSTVNWNGVPLATTFVSGSRLTAMVPAADIATQITASVTVTSPVPGGGASNVAIFDVRAPFRDSSFDQVDSPAGNGAALPIAADFNRDGKLDVAVLDPADSAVGVLLGNGDSTFQPLVEYQVGSQPSGWIGGDFNGDGNIDLAVYDATGLIYVLSGNGDGTFQAKKTSPTFGGIGIAAGDFNEDGKLDLALTIASPGGELLTMLGNGDGTFQRPVQYPIGSFATGVAVGDFNKDGHLDVAVTAFTSGKDVAAIFLGNGDGTFQDNVNYSTARNARAVIVADLNGDSNLDLAIKSGDFFSGAISILLGNANGTFRRRQEYTTSGDQLMSAADLNGNGRLDLIVPDHIRNAAEVFLGDRTGHLEHPGYFQTGGHATGAATGDFNNDGLIDIVTGNSFVNTISVLPQVTAVLSETLAHFRVKVGATGTEKVTLTNISSATLRVTFIGLEGADSGDFSQTNDCLAGVAPGTDCTITIVFSPTVVHGIGDARVAIRDSAVSVTQKIILQGAGTN